MQEAAATPAATAAQAAGALEQRLQRAQAALAAGDAYEALLQAEAALAIDEASVAAHVVHAGALEALGDALGARTSLSRAAELEPGRARLHWAIAVSSLSLADFPAALREGRYALEAGFEPAQVRRLFDALADQGVAGIPAVEEVLALPSIAVRGGAAEPERALQRAILALPEVRLAPDPAAASCLLEVGADAPVRGDGGVRVWRVRATTPSGRTRALALSLTAPAAGPPAAAGSRPAPTAMNPRRLVQEVAQWLVSTSPRAR